MKLKYKLSLFIAVLIVFLAASVMLIGINREIKGKEEKTANHAKIAAKIIATFKVSEILSNKPSDPVLLSNVIKLSVGLDPTIAFIVVSDGSGRVLDGEVNERWIEMDKNAGKLKTLEYLSQKGFVHRDLKSLSVDINKGDNVFGTVKIAFSLKPLAREILEAKIATIILGIVTLLAGFSGAFFIAGRITNPISIITSAMQKVKGGDFNQLVAIKRNDEIGYVARTFNIMTEGLKERERIKETFSRYVSRQVAEKILKEKDSIYLKGEKRRVTVLFSDIRGFTALAEKLPPEDVVSLLNDYFSIMVDIIFRYGGTLDKFIGDALMAVFNAPANQDDPELRAVITGLRMQEALSDLNRKRLSNGKTQIITGIGINTGEVIAGNIGSEKRLEYTVIGREVNLAQRIESKTQKGELLISEKTYEYVKDNVEVMKLQPVELKGIEGKVSVYAVIGLSCADPFIKEERI